MYSRAKRMKLLRIIKATAGFALKITETWNVY